MRALEREAIAMKAGRDNDQKMMVKILNDYQQASLKLEEIKDILDLKDHGASPCRRVAEISEQRLRALDAEIAKLRSFRRGLAAALPDWQRETAVERVCAGQF